MGFYQDQAFPRSRHAPLTGPEHADVHGPPFPRLKASARDMAVRERERLLSAGGWGWQPSSVTGVVLSVVLALVGNLATRTVRVSWCCGFWLLGRLWCC